METKSVKFPHKLKKSPFNQGGLILAPGTFILHLYYFYLLLEFSILKYLLLKVVDSWNQDKQNLRNTEIMYQCKIKETEISNYELFVSKRKWPREIIHLLS